MKQTNPTPLRSASLVVDNYMVDIDFKDDGSISDITVFDEDQQIIFGETLEQADKLIHAIEFAKNYNYGINAFNDEPTGLEDDNQEIE